MFRKIRRASIVMVLLCTGIVPAYAQDDAAPVKIAVMDLKAKQGIAGPVVSSLTDYACTRIDMLGGYEVLGRDDMQAMLEHIADRQLLDCDDTKCLAQVGGALGVGLLVSGNIGMIGSRYLINVKLIDIDEVRVVHRVSREYRGTEGGLIDEMTSVVSEIFGRSAPAVAVAPASTTASGGEAGCMESKLKGTADADQVSTSTWMLAGAGCGTTLGCLGGGLVYVMAGQDGNIDPETIPEGVEPACYVMGYKEKLKKKKKSSACYGSVAGVLIASLLVSLQLGS